MIKILLIIAISALLSFSCRTKQVVVSHASDSIALVDDHKVIKNINSDKSEITVQALVDEKSIFSKDYAIIDYSKPDSTGSQYITREIKINSRSTAIKKTNTATNIVDSSSSSSIDLHSESTRIRKSDQSKSSVKIDSGHADRFNFTSAVFYFLVFAAIIILLLRIWRYYRSHRFI